MNTESLIINVLVAYSVALVVAGSLSGPIGWARALIVKVCGRVKWTPSKDKNPDSATRMTWLQREVSAFLGCPACMGAWIGLGLWICEMQNVHLVHEILSWMFLPGGFYLTIIAFRSTGTSRTGCGGTGSRRRERPTSMTPTERAAMENIEVQMTGQISGPWTTEGRLGSQ